MLFPRPLLVSPALILAIATTATSTDTKPVLVEQGRIDVTITSAPTHQLLQASIRTTFQLRNVSNQADNSRRVIPVAAPQVSRFTEGQNPWCHVTVDGKPVKIETKVLVEPSNGFGSDPNIIHRANWTDRINQWIQRDARLSKLVTRYRKFVESASGLYDVTDEFKKRIATHLIHADELSYAAICVATDPLDFLSLIKLMPEIDSQLRIDGEYHRWRYVSVLRDNLEAYRPYEQE